MSRGHWIKSIVVKTLVVPDKILPESVLFVVLFQAFVFFQSVCHKFSFSSSTPTTCRHFSYSRLYLIHLISLARFYWAEKDRTPVTHIWTPNRLHVCQWEWQDSGQVHCRHHAQQSHGAVEDECHQGSLSANVGHLATRIRAGSCFQSKFEEEEPVADPRWGRRVPLLHGWTEARHIAGPQLCDATRHRHHHSRCSHQSIWRGPLCAEQRPGPL